MNLHHQKQKSLPVALRNRIGWAPEGLHAAALLLCRIQAQPLQLQKVLNWLEQKTDNRDAISLYLPLKFSWLLMPRSSTEEINFQRSNNQGKNSQWLHHSVIKVNLFFQNKLEFNRYNTYSTSTIQRDIPAKMYFTEQHGRAFRKDAEKDLRLPGITKEITYLKRHVLFQDHLHDVKRHSLKPAILPMAQQNVHDVGKDAEKDLRLPDITKEVTHLKRHVLLPDHLHDLKRHSFNPAILPLVQQNVHDVGKDAEKDLRLPDITKEITYPKRHVLLQDHLHDVKRHSLNPTILSMVLHTVQSVRTEKPHTQYSTAHEAKSAQVFRSSPTVRRQASDASVLKAHSATVTSQSTNAVERLFEIGMASQPMQGLSLHDISSNEAAILNAIEKKVANSASTFQNNPIVQNNHEIHQLADKVSRILQQRERFERERRGEF